MTLVCSDCSHENPQEAGFCQNCGQLLMIDCASCGTSNTLKAKFCLQCGTRLGVISDPERESKLRSLQETAPHALREKIKAAQSEIEGERKPVTIVFTDIVGSTTIAEKLDPEVWKEIVVGAHKRVGEAVYRYEGTIAQLLGDGVLAFFGAPITHEDDPIRAVRAAMDIQESVKAYAQELGSVVDGFQMRIGINTGTVVIGEIGTDMHVEYLAIGDAVNVAARLQSAAEPGKVVISEPCARLVSAEFELKDLGEIRVKGKSESLQAFELISVKAEPETGRGIEGLLTPYVGRAQEVEKLQSSLLSLCAGHGQIVVVMGDAGIGLICLIPLICLLIPLGIALTIYTLLTQIALIVEELDIVAAFQRAWEVFRSNLGEVVLMGLILGVGGFVVGLILAIPFILMALPFITGLIVGTGTSSVAGFSMTLIGILLYLPILLVASGIMRTFITGSWTLTYRSLIASMAE